jgi:tight adherence protein C
MLGQAAAVVAVPDSVVLAASVFATFVAITMLVVGVTTPVQTPGMRLNRYLRYTGRKTSPAADVEVLSFRERIIAPVARRLVEFAARAAPSRARNSVAAELTMAGSRANPTMFLGISTIVMIGFPAVALLSILASGAPTPLHWLVLVMSLIWGRRLTSMWLKRRIRARQHAIDRRLPYALDLMVACLEGGLSLDAALAKVAEQSDGPLAAEIRRTLQELALGRPTIEAVRDLGERTGAPGLKRLTEDVAQAERMGISIAESLRTLAQDSRIQRRQRAEELARKAPIKMVPVLIFCVLPALGIVTTAPAVILLMRTFSQTR